MQEKITILAVDDEPFNLDLIEAAFIDYENLTIVNAIDGIEALEALKKQEFDVVLLDISMPRMNGLEVLHEIRKNSELEQLPILMVTANAEKEQEALDAGASDFISKPYDIDILCARTLNYAKMNSYYKQIKNQKAILEEKVKERTQELQNTLEMAKQTEYEISIRLGRASEFRDLETGGHIKRMSHYSQLLAHLYGLDDEKCELILYAAPLHDIGKVGIPDNILLKPGRFTHEEFNVMKMHSQLGAKMLEGADKFPVLKVGHIIALQHHEKWNGTGYPNGLRGEEIDLYARIVAIADVFDALSSKRCYKDAMPFEKVLSIMKQDAGTHFDPELIDIFLTNLDKFLEIKERFSDDDSVHTIMDIIKGIKN
jgi:putative two-component system response regulator